jgi:hypothetical protein
MDERQGLTKRRTCVRDKKNAVQQNRIRFGFLGVRAKKKQRGLGHTGSSDQQGSSEHTQRLGDFASSQKFG